MTSGANFRANFVAFAIVALISLGAFEGSEASGLGDTFALVAAAAACAVCWFFGSMARLDKVRNMSFPALLLFSGFALANLSYQIVGVASALLLVGSIGLVLIGSLVLIRRLNDEEQPAAD
jgi:hypothetical protein